LRYPELLRYLERLANLERLKSLDGWVQWQICSNLTITNGSDMLPLPCRVDRSIGM
jgi:hypothetical protein